MEPGNALEVQQKDLASADQPIDLGTPRSYGYRAIPEEPSLNKYWLVLRKRKWTVVATLVVFVTLAALISFRTKPQYLGVARIAINRENPDPLGLKGSTESTGMDDWNYEVAIDTQSKILESDRIALEVIKQLQLDKNPAFMPGLEQTSKLAKPGQPEELDPETAAALIDTFHGDLSVVAIPRTRLMEIRFLSTDPHLAAQIANALTSAFIENNFKTKYEATMQTSDWLQKQLADLQLRVETAQERLVRYQREHGILETSDKQNIVTDKLARMNADLTTAESDRIQKEALYRLVQAGDVSLITKDDPLLEKLVEHKAELSSQYAQLTTQFGPSYPKVLELRNQLDDVNGAIEQERTKLGDRAKADYQASMTRERMLRAAFENQKAEANKQNEAAIEYNLLKRDVDTGRQLYEGLLQKMKEAGVSAGLRSSNVQIVDEARPPLRPAKPNIPRNMELGFLMGLFGGIGLAFLVESLDNTVRTPDEASLVSGLPSLGVIPLEQKLQSGRNGNAKSKSLLASTAQRSGTGTELITYSRPNSEIAESYRALRTSILLSSLGAPPRVILITSSLPKEGKTTTSINTAMVLAQRGSRVLLVDCDLRRPNVHKVLGVHSNFGLSTLLTGSSTEEQAIMPTQHANLFVLPAGPVPPHPAELLGSRLMAEKLSEWRTKFDHVVLDSPPALSVTDAVLLSVNADAVLVVLRSGQTTKDALRRTRDLLLQVNARVMGVVVNALDLSSPDFYHYYYYGSKNAGQGGYYTDSASDRN
jgi:capsular exopolysaccharide synthesis family protein